MRGLEFLLEKKTAIILMALLAFLLLFAKPLLVVILLLLANLIVGLLVRPFKYFLAGIEIVTLITIATSLAYGGVAGAIVGGIALIMNFIAIARLTSAVVAFLPTMAILALMAPLFASAGITKVGIGANIAYNSVVLLWVALFSNDAMKGLTYIGVNTAFNVFLFTTVAPGLLRAMG